MPDLPHPAWPLQFETGGGFRLVEQDSSEDLLASAAIIACTPRGHRDDNPSFGISSVVFQQGDLDVDRLAAELAASDLRLTVDAGEVIDLANATVRTINAQLGGS